MVRLSAILIIVCGCQLPPDYQPATTAATGKPELLFGEWVSDTQENVERVTRLNFKADGSVELKVEGEEPERRFYVREPITQFQIRLRAEVAKSHPEMESKLAQNGVDFGATYGYDAEVVSLSNGPIREPEPGGLFMFYNAKRQILVNPMAARFVRPGQEKRYSKRKDAGDGSHVPFRFLAAQSPIFADKTTGDWAYTWKADWRTLLKTAAKELRAAGFDGPNVENDPKALDGKAGSVFFYLSSDSENVGLSPNTHSRWVGGKWITDAKVGWVTVHVNIKAVNQQRQP